MSKKRQAPILDPRSSDAYDVTTLSYDYPAGYAVPEHSHDTGQLIFAERGVMTIRTQGGTWIVPTNRAVCIPADMPHSLQMSGFVSMRTLYIRLGAIDSFPTSCCVVHVSGLLRELITHICKKQGLKSNDQKDKHLLDVIADQLEVIETVPFQLPRVSDVRAQDIADFLLSAPADQRSLDQICRSYGTTKRTMERIFLTETGMTLGKWRQQVRLLQALRSLAVGESVTRAALDAGYSNASAFIHMFKKAFGVSPAKYFL